MRNAFIIVALFLAAATAMTTQTATFSKLDRIAGNQFGKTILETIQVQLQTSADPRPKILQLLEELKQQSIEAQIVADEDHRVQQEFYSNTLTEIEESINTLTTTIKNDSEEKLEKEAELSAAQTSLETHTRTRNGYEEELRQAGEARTANQQLFEEKDTKFQRIIDVLTQVRAWIQTRRDNRYSSFLQKKENIFSNLVQLNSQDFLNASPGYGKLIGFLATKVQKVFEPAAEDVIAESGLDSILAVIDNLIAHFNGEKTANYNWNQEDIKIYEAKKQRLDGDIANENAVIASLNLQIAALTRRISELKSAIETNEALLTSKQNEKVNTEMARDNEQRLYETATENRKREFDIIDEVIDIVQNQLTGLREYTENRIINSDIKVDF